MLSYVTSFDSNVRLSRKRFHVTLILGKDDSYRNAVQNKENNTWQNALCLTF